MQEGGDGALLVQALRGCECEDIDAGKIAVGAGFDEPLNGARRISIRRCAECGEKGLGIAHTRFPVLSCPAQAGHPVIACLPVNTGSSACADDDNRDVIAPWDRPQ